MSKPKMPKVQYPDPPPPAPERNDEATAALAEAQRSGFFRKGGRASTFLGGSTGGQTSSAMRVLGGGV